MPFPMLATRYVREEALSQIFGQTISASRLGNYPSVAQLEKWVKAIKKLPSTMMNTDPAFLSASTNESQNVFYNSYNVKLQIEIPPNTPMYLTDNYQESEIILGRGTLLDFIGVTVGKMKDRWGYEYKHITIRCRVGR